MQRPGGLRSRERRRFVGEGGEFYEDEYEAYVWRALEAFERGKGEGRRRRCL